MYIRCIDGLRAFAILLVLLSHMVRTNTPLWFREVFNYWNAGTVGVRLFFILSGFLITAILNKEIQKNGKINFKNFFMRRLLRIFPAFYFYLIILALLSFLDILVIDASAIFFAIFYVQNLNMFQLTEAFPTSWLVKHSWSLSVEEQFYVVFPFVLKKIKSIIENHLIMMMIFMTLVCTFFRALNYSFPEVSRMTGGVFFMHCDFFLYGGLVALYLEDIKKSNLVVKLSPLRYWLLAVALITLVYASRFEYYSAINIAIFGNMMLFSSLYVLLFFLLFPDSIIGHIFEQKPVRFIGKLSYSLYIWQQLFLGSTGMWLKYEFLSTYPYNIFVIFFCAFCSYILIEKPFLTLKKKYV